MKSVVRSEKHEMGVVYESLVQDFHLVLQVDVGLREFGVLLLELSQAFLVE